MGNTPTHPSGTQVQPQRASRRPATAMRIPERRNRTNPRVFLLKWNNAHKSIADPLRYIWSECWGTLYPNGKVTLDYGTPFDSMSDLREHISLVGTYLFQWLEEEHRTLSAPEGTAVDMAGKTNGGC